MGSLPVIVVCLLFLCFDTFGCRVLCHLVSTLFYVPPTVVRVLRAPGKIEFVESNSSHKSHPAGTMGRDGRIALAILEVNLEFNLKLAWPTSGPKITASEIAAKYGTWTKKEDGSYALMGAPEPEAMERGDMDA